MNTDDGFKFIEENFEVVVTRGKLRGIVVIRIMQGDRLVTKGMGGSIETAGATCYMNIYKMFRNEIASIEAERER